MNKIDVDVTAIEKALRRGYESADYGRADAIRTRMIQEAVSEAMLRVEADPLMSRVALYQIEQEKLHPVGCEFEIDGITGKVIGYCCGYPMVEMPSIHDELTVQIRTPDLRDEICTAPSDEVPNLFDQSPKWLVEKLAADDRRTFEQLKDLIAKEKGQPSGS